MTQNYPLYLIALLPLLGAALNLLFGRRWGNSVVSLVACGSVAGAALVATKGVLLLAHDHEVRLAGRGVRRASGRDGRGEREGEERRAHVVLRRGCWSGRRHRSPPESLAPGG